MPFCYIKYNNGATTWEDVNDQEKNLRNDHVWGMARDRKTNMLIIRSCDTTNQLLSIVFLLLLLCVWIFSLMEVYILNIISWSKCILLKWHPLSSQDHEYRNSTRILRQWSWLMLYLHIDKITSQYHGFTLNNFSLVNGTQGWSHPTHHVPSGPVCHLNRTLPSVRNVEVKKDPEWVKMDQPDCFMSTYQSIQ